MSAIDRFKLAPVVIDRNDTAALLAERRTTHGDFLVQGALAQQLKSTMRKLPGWIALSDAQKEALDMIAHKMSRIVAGNPNHADHWRDIAGYAMLINDILPPDPEMLP